ncbi:hypothetical protein BC829DRAFT_378287 [Chytridium lagenaria]|nr:hypothetical protein BC829DRAFT_378287 [Chytridium lagenaria]
MQKMNGSNTNIFDDSNINDNNNSNASNNSSGMNELENTTAIPSPTSSSRENDSQELPSAQGTFDVSSHTKDFFGTSQLSADILGNVPTFDAESLMMEIQEFHGKSESLLNSLTEELFQLYQDMAQSLWGQSNDFFEYTGYNASLNIQNLQETERMQEISRAKLAGFYSALRESFGHYLQGSLGN